MTDRRFDTHPPSALRRGLLALLLLPLAGCSAFTALNALAPDATHTVRRDIAYGKLPRQKLDVYTPATNPPVGGFPLVVFFYGGSWNRGERADYAFIGEALASRGVVALVADYRLYPEVSYPDFLPDCAAAVAYALGHTGLLSANPKRVFVMGHSAGAYNAAMLALDARWLKATGHATTELAGWIGLAGPYDFYPIENPDVKPVFHHPDYPPDSQPIADARPGIPPRAFLGAPRSDNLVDPQRNTVQMADKLRAVGVDVTSKLYGRVNHMTLAGAFAVPLRWLAPVLDDVAAFIQGAPPGGT